MSPEETEERIVDQLLMDADSAFERADLEVASHLFQSIIDEHPDSKFAPYAAYKLAWCRFNEGDRPEAIRSLELLEAWLQTSEAPGREELLVSARKDLERFRSSDDEPIEAADEDP